MAGTVPTPARVAYLLADVRRWLREEQAQLAPALAPLRPADASPRLEERQTGGQVSRREVLAGLGLGDLVGVGGDLGMFTE